MRIGIDARLWSESGIGRYIRNLVENLGQIDKKNEYFLFLLKKNLTIKVPENFTKVAADIPWYGLSEQLKMPKIIQSQKVDIMHFPHFNIPVFYSGKFVVTIHDLIHQHFRMNRATTLNPLIYQIKHLTYKRVFYQSLKKSQKIITVSNYVKECLKKEMGVSAEKIVITKEAVEAKFIELGNATDESEIDRTHLKLGIQKPFIFYVGNAHPHKNVEGLIKAFLKLKKDIPNLQLVLSGNDHYFWQRIKENYVDKDIIYTGFITDQELICLYKSARAFIMPSFEEGFGIPILEAFALECPVVSSDRASLPEVGGEGCVYFDPGNIDQIVEKITMVIKDETVRKKLISVGVNRYKKFGWKTLAAETLEVYQKVL